MGDLGERSAALLGRLEAEGSEHQARLRQHAQQELQRIDSEHAAAVEAQKQRFDAAMAEVQVEAT